MIKLHFTFHGLVNVWAADLVAAKWGATAHLKYKHLDNDLRNSEVCGRATKRRQRSSSKWSPLGKREPVNDQRQVGYGNLSNYAAAAVVGYY